MPCSVCHGPDDSGIHDTAESCEARGPCQHGDRHHAYTEDCDAAYRRGRAAASDDVERAMARLGAVSLERDRLLRAGSEMAVAIQRAPLPTARMAAARMAWDESVAARQETT
jgi:hypothetical protein